MKAGYLIFIRIIGALAAALIIPITSLYADDTIIYGCGSVSVEPNILIIFDTSGSMSTEDVPSEYYDPDTTYSGSYTRDAVYRYRYRKWNWFADDVDDLNCPDIKEELESSGITTGAIYGSAGSYACGGSSKYLSTGNYLNYDTSSSGDMDSRINVAKEVISDLVENTEDVRFGLMRFNYSQGGRVLLDIQSTSDDDYKAELLDAIDDLSARGYTPLAETLAEAGLYFAGADSWFNNADSYSDDILTSSKTYTSPMQYRCQKNYIILMTDGSPTQDNDFKLETGSYINEDGDTIGDYDEDGNSGDAIDSSSSDYLDDVAAYLYENDCNPDLGEDDDTYETQRIITYTIGFQTDQDLLEDTAENGGGEYYSTNSISGLSEAFESIISKILEANSSYVSPVVPVSSMNYVYSGDAIYLGFFATSDDGLWRGNIKKYGLNDDGDILDVNGDNAINSDGNITDDAQSYWSEDEDGSTVTQGGVGEVLMDNADRKLYTYLGTDEDLTIHDNSFSTDNDLLTYSELDVEDNDEKEDVITDIIGFSSDWKMADVIHSTPVVAYYDDLGESYIFSGTNGGIMHAFKDSDGSEAWGFIPRPHLSRLQFLSDNINDHDYFVDAAPVIHDDGTDKTLFFGERRGGYNYYALDVTDPETPLSLYKIDQTFLAGVDSDNDGDEDGEDAYLGQSWGAPCAHTIKTDNESQAEVFLLGGGYDDNQDLDSPEDRDNEGRAVFSVSISSGELSAINFNAANFSDMTHCIVDLTGFDANSDGYTNRIYAGDLNGNIWAFEDDDDPTDEYIGGDGVWSGRRLFSAGAEDGVQRKIFYAPDVVLEVGEDMIFFGTGDRADPEETGVVNRFYAIRNPWTDEGSFETLTEDDLVDVTDNLIQTGTDEEQETVSMALENSEGWFIQLENEGEKIISSVIVYNSVVYFTTYEPEDDSDEDSDDPCDAGSGLGTSRFYAIDYENGSAVMDFDADGEYDRSTLLGASIASSPVIGIFPNGAKIYMGLNGGIETVDPIQDLQLNRFYWRQAF